MRREPTWRIPVGILALLVALGIYGLAIARWIAPLVSGWPGIAQFPVYLALGLLWLWPMKPYLKWMETGRWR